MTLGRSPAYASEHDRRLTVASASRSTAAWDAPGRGPLTSATRYTRLPRARKASCWVKPSGRPAFARPSERAAARGAHGEHAGARVQKRHDRESQARQEGQHARSLARAPAPVLCKSEWVVRLTTAALRGRPTVLALTTAALRARPRGVVHLCAEVPEHGSACQQTRQASQRRPCEQQEREQHEQRRDDRLVSGESVLEATGVHDAVEGDPGQQRARALLSALPREVTAAISAGAARCSMTGCGVLGAHRLAIRCDHGLRRWR
jgi:hypothetical protein